MNKVLLYDLLVLWFVISEICLVVCYVKLFVIIYEMI